MHVLDGLYDIWELISMMRSSHMRELMVMVVLVMDGGLNDDQGCHGWVTMMAGSWMIRSGAYRGEISSSEWQCGQLRTAHNVYGLKISRVEVNNSPSLWGESTHHRR